MPDLAGMLQYRADVHCVQVEEIFNWDFELNKFVEQSHSCICFLNKILSVAVPREIISYNDTKQLSF